MTRNLYPSIDRFDILTLNHVATYDISKYDHNETLEISVRSFRKRIILQNMFVFIRQWTYSKIIIQFSKFMISS